MVRTSLTWRILGENLVGTCHVATGAGSVAVLLVNAGSAPRSGNSDLSVRIGDRLAQCGFTVFRFDLDGLGDSTGSTPVDVDSYRNEVQSGRNDAATVALIERIQNEPGIERVVVGGLCAGTLPSVRALESRTPPAGLILLEPNFRLPPEEEPGEEKAGVARSLRALLHSVKRRIGHELPGDLNEPLVACWLESFSRGVRSLVVVASDEGTHGIVARILEFAPERAPDAVTCVEVPRTNHLFTRGTGRDGVSNALERWMVENFGARVLS